MGVALLLVPALVVLAFLEWRYARPGIRVLTGALAVLVVLAAQPNYTVAVRLAAESPPEERVSEVRGVPLSEYVSGVLTMDRAVADVSEAPLIPRLVGVGILFWLVISPIVGASGRRLGRRGKRNQSTN